MNNFTNSLKKVIRDKNTVTIIGVIVIIALLYLGYKWEIKKAVDPVRGIPVAANDIQPRTLITSDMVSTIDVAPIMLTDNVIRNSGSIIGKYSNYNTMIPQGSMFYNGVVVEASALPNSTFVNLKKGEIAYNFPVTTDSTYGNSILPETAIDIYMKATDTDGKIMVGKLIENVEILAVKDSAGKNVFENTSEDRTPAFLIFGLKSDLYLLLKKASYMNSNDVELYPVPMGQTFDVESATQVSTQYLKDFINANTVTISEEELTQDTNTTDSNTSNTANTTSNSKTNTTSNTNKTNTSNNKNS